MVLFILILHMISYVEILGAENSYSIFLEDFGIVRYYCLILCI